MKNKGSICMNTGLLLIGAALLLAIYNFYDAGRAERAAGEAYMALVTEMAASPVDEDKIYEKYPFLEMPTKEIDGREYIGTLDIPALGLSLPVLSDLDGSGLRIAPCRYKGSVYSKDIIIAAHNYKSHFGPLRDLYLGADVKFTDVLNNEFDYMVTGVETIPTHSVKEMDIGDWDMTLFTCTTSGNERVTLRCTLK